MTRSRDLSATASKPRSAPPAGGFLLPLTALLATVLAHGSLLTRHPGGFPSPPGAALWPGVASLSAAWAGLEEGAPPAILVALALLAAAGWCTGLLALRSGLPIAGAMVAAFLFCVAPAGGAALRDRSGGVALLATLALLGCTLLAGPGRPDVPRWLRRAPGIGLAALAVWWSQGAFLPLLVLAVLMSAQRRQRVGGGMRFAVAGLVALFCLVPLVLAPLVSAFGFGHALHDGLAAPPRGSDGSVTPGPTFLAAILLQVGVGGDVPFLVRPAVHPGLSQLWSGLVVLLLLLLPTFASGPRRVALRVGGVGIVLVGFGAVLVEVLGRGSAIPAALVLPGASCLGLTVAGMLAARRLEVRRWAVLAGLVLLAFTGWLLVESRRLAADGPTELFARAVERAPLEPYGAVRLFEEQRRSGGRGDPAMLARVLEERWERPLPPAVERRVGLRYVQELELLDRSAAAVDFLDRWLQQRPDGALAQARALRIRLLLGRGDFDTALERIAADRTGREADPEYERRVAEVFLDHLEGLEAGSQLPEAALDVIEDLVDRALQSPEPARLPARLALAHLRVLQGRLVEAVRLAEECARDAPRSARPQLFLARLYLGSGEVEAGLQAVRSALRLDASDPAARFLEGRLLASTPSRAEDGVRQMLEALAEEPEIVGGTRMLVDGTMGAVATLRQGGSPQEARALFELLEERVPVTAPMLLEQARLTRLDGRLEETCALYRLALQRDPGLIEARVELAELLRDEGYRRLLGGDRPAAVECFREVVALAAPDVTLDAMQQVIDAHDSKLAERARGERARAAFDEALRQFEKGDLDAAADGLRRSLELAPGNPLAWLNLGRIELQRQEAAAAETALRRAIESSARVEIDVEAAWPLLLQALLEQEKLDAAEVIARDYLRRYPNGQWRERVAELLGDDADPGGR